jgi:hypothetical protein
MMIRRSACCVWSSEGPSITMHQKLGLGRKISYMRLSLTQEVLQNDVADPIHATDLTPETIRISIGIDKPPEHRKSSVPNPGSYCPPTFSSTYSSPTCIASTPYICMEFRHTTYVSIPFPSFPLIAF